MESGFVMVVVIVSIGLLAMAASTFAKVTRTQVRASAIAVETARANALAAAGINLGVLKLLSFRSHPTGKERDFALGAQPFRCRIGNDVLVTAAVDEGGKIDLNFAGERLLRALLIGLDVEPAKAEALVDAILDYRDGDDVKRPKGAEQADYLAAGRLEGPKNAPFAATEELSQVFGLDPELLAKVTPFVTTHSGKEGVDPAVVQRRLKEILRRGDAAIPSVDTNLDLLFEDRSIDLPPAFVAHSTKNIFTVRTDVLTTSGVRFALEAVVDLTPSRPNGPLGSQDNRPVYHLWRWRRVPSTDPEAAIVIPTDAVSECELFSPA